MFIFAEATLRHISVHKLNIENSNVLYSDAPINISSDWIADELVRHATWAFEEKAELYQFRQMQGDENDRYAVHQAVSSYWADDMDFHALSKLLAMNLFQSANHHQVKSGEFILMALENVIFEDQLIRCLALIKSESKDSFITFADSASRIDLSHHHGILITKLDKAAIIYDVIREDGYRLSIVDRKNGRVEAQYWREHFLVCENVSDAFHYTKRYMNLTETYLKHKLEDEFQIDGADRANLIRRTADYFKSNDSFDEETYQKEVLQDDNVIHSFNQYKESSLLEFAEELPDSFPISHNAVKRYAKNFKSVLKLDKNFHIYIHGDRSMIESGSDSDGRKYYKLYFDTES